MEIHRFRELQKLLHSQWFKLQLDIQDKAVRPRQQLTATNRHHQTNQQQIDQQTRNKLQYLIFEGFAREKRIRTSIVDLHLKLKPNLMEHYLF